MAEIKLVTQNDEPALALGEYLLSEDGETLYVGSAGVESGSSEIIYKGISPAQIKIGVFSRLKTINAKLNVTPQQVVINNTTDSFLNTINKNINTNTNDVSIKLEEVM